MASVLVKLRAKVCDFTKNKVITGVFRWILQNFSENPFLNNIFRWLPVYAQNFWSQQTSITEMVYKHIYSVLRLSVINVALSKTVKYNE